MPLTSLPIEAHVEAIADGIARNTVSILQAPPGSGKTTILPLFLARQPWLHGKKIVILQPRRLAAKAVAQRMSDILGESVGQTVGYQIRLERRITAATRIEIITEGLLLRRMLADPELRDVGLIIFDEFHERSLHSDVGFPIALEVASVLRSDLKLLIMSATLDSLRDVPCLSSAWHYTFESKPFPVAINYTPRTPRVPVWEDVARVIKAALLQHEGDLLAFLPGAYEIERCLELLESTNNTWTVLPLYGELPYEQQRLALEPLSNSRRKVVLATNIAETSLTIDGVRIVVDAGLQKVSRSNEIGITTLQAERITRDAAEQRAGRAGRTGPGVCIRLWSEQEHHALRASREPEVLRADLSQSVLELASWGIKTPETFNWITPPPHASLQSASTLLLRLEAIREDGSITPTGLHLVGLGAHPRVAACCIAARSHNLEPYAAAIIAILEERAVSQIGARLADCSPLVEALAHGSNSERAPARVKQLQQLWFRRMENLPSDTVPQGERVPQEAACGFLLAVAFPERIARRRADSRERYLLASGVGATIQTNDPLGSSEFIVVAEMQEGTEDAQIVRAAPLAPQLFKTHLHHLLTTHCESKFDGRLGVMVSHKVMMLGSVLLNRERILHMDSGELHSALVDYLRTAEGFERLCWSPSALALQARCTWVRTAFPSVSMADTSPEALRCSDPFWLAGRLPLSGRLDDISSSALEESLVNYLPWANRRDLDEIAPHSFTLPSGKSKQIDYSEGFGPVLEATIQELFGLRETPLVGRFKTPVTLKLLSPARRPMQVTKDLASFWNIGYSAVRKELRGRYPKHKWPEDPTKG
jgi:ATP-dependent helicase HrpB